MKTQLNTTRVLTLLSCFAFAATSHAAISVVADGSSLDTTDWVSQGFGDVAYSFFQTGSGTDLLGGELDGGYISQNIVGGSIGSETGDDDGVVAIQNTAGTATDLFVGNRWAFGLGNDDLVDSYVYTFGAGTVSELRLGILVGVAETATGGTNPIDVPSTLAVDGISQTTSAPSSNQADWYFFSIGNISAGDTLTVQASRVSSTSQHRFTPVNGVVFSAIPEPNAFALITGLLAFGILLRRRRA